MADIKSWTGERLETFVYNENTNEHLHRYALAMQLAAGKRVLDIACGEGYGSHMLAGVAETVMGVDIDADTVRHASEKYRRHNLAFTTGSADKIPCSAASMDLVVSFETLEHHDRHEEMMREIKRILAPGGLLIISSPDKLYYSDKTGFKNPFHVKELYRHEFESLLDRYFTHTSFLSQRSLYGSVIIPYPGRQVYGETSLYHGDYNLVNKSGLEAAYIVGLASDSPLPLVDTSLLDGMNVLRKQFEAFREEVVKEVVAVVTKEIRNSWSFRIGHAVLWPVRLLKKIFYG